MRKIKLFRKEASEKLKIIDRIIQERKSEAVLGGIEIRKLELH